MPFDVFNGDADGLCALQQLRLNDPQEDAQLITGPKRETALLRKVPRSLPTQITVLDISLRNNREEVERLLLEGHQVSYFDHHNPGPLPEHPHFLACIDTDPLVCTSVLVDRHLKSRFRPWAIAAAFGDNLPETALQLAHQGDFSEKQILQLQELGELLNYNGYGRTLADLWFSPAELFWRLHPYEDPLDFYQEAEEFGQLREGYAEDLRHAQQAPLIYESEMVRAHVLPDAAWSHRISGSFSNQLIQQDPNRAQVTLVELPSSGYLVSVRAPKTRPSGADEVCLQFEGGGRPAAAGINDLSAEQLGLFWQTLEGRFAAGQGG